MLNVLPSPLLGLLILFLYTLNLFICGSIAFVFALLQRIPIPGWRNAMMRGFYHMPSLWASNNQKIQRLANKIVFEITLPEDLHNDGHYLVVSNHQSWADILILFNLLDQRIPMLKLFPKKELLWVPILGQLCWLYGFPFMHRHTKSELQKHPEWKGKDLRATQKACERFKDHPGSIMIFVEGSRYSDAKRAKQNSPYQHLLRPKAGGLAYALQSMDGLIKTLIDVTIVYPPTQHSFWDLCCGKIKKIVVDVEAISLSEALKGDYEGDEKFRAHFQQFINSRWKTKDERIQAIKVSHFNTAKIQENQR